MKKILFLFILTFTLYFIQSCKSKKLKSEINYPTVESSKVDSSLKLVFHDTVNYIRQIVDSIKIGKSNSLIGEHILEEKALPEFYLLNDYHLIWADSVVRDKAILQLISAWKEGLNPKDYHLASILELNDYLKHKPYERRSKAIMDILLSDGVLEYSQSINQGKLDPESMYPTWNFFSRNVPQDALNELLVAIDHDSIDAYLSELSPKSTNYKVLKDNLLIYNDYVRLGGWKPLPAVNSIHPKDTSVFIPLLRARLHAEGYAVVMDSSLIYDQELVSQVMLFQLNSGLKPDGVIGKRTLSALNESAEEKLKKIKVNMERSRWVLDGELNAFIVVNIASYQLYYNDSGEVTYTTKVMVGTDEKQTPVFRDYMEYIVFNPTWTLPTSISSTETLAQLKRDSLYLKKHNMVIIDSKGEVQSDSGIVWKDYSEDYFPFMFRQEPGPGNALGRVKFLFPNKYAIYLHDTPSRHLFAKEERAFSHGCIRVQNPLAFAEFLLSKQDTLWTMDSIQTVIESAQTMSVRLEKSIPIYLMYWTAGENKNGEIFFVPDVYGRDERIINALGEH